jgi:hypothetical protein
MNTFFITLLILVSVIFIGYKIANRKKVSCITNIIDSNVTHYLITCNGKEHVVISTRVGNLIVVEGDKGLIKFPYSPDWRDIAKNKYIKLL